jgi:hypothetical protein
VDDELHIAKLFYEALENIDGILVFSFVDPVIAYRISTLYREL